MKREFWLAAGMAALMTPTAAQAQGTSEDSDQDLGLQDIIVTAERREAVLQRIPVTVSAFNAEELADRQITNLVDIVKDVPNLIGHNNAGLSSATTIFLRGVGSTQAFATVDTTVGFYVDDVYIARQNANNFSLFDVERLEVLRGPQGTLYGRNTSGGAIKVVLKKPQPRNEAIIEGNIGNYQTYGSKAAANIVAADNLYLRFNAGTQQQGRGFARNLTTGRRDNDRSVDALRGALRWEPSSTFEFNLSADYISDYSNGVVPVDVRGAARPSTGDLFLTSSGMQTYNDVTTWGVTSNARLDTSFGHVTSITSYRRLKQDVSQDLSDQPTPLYILDYIGHHKQFSQELQFGGDAFNDRLEWIAGAFFMKEWNSVGTGDTYASVRNGVLFPPVGRQFKVIDNGVRSIAVFAQGTYEVLPDFKLTAGLRYTDDWKDVAVVQYDALGNLSYDTTTLIDLGVPTELRYKKWSPKFGLSWQVSDDILAFANYAKGFKSGGWNSRVVNPLQFYDVAPEFVSAYELGLKTQLFNHRVRLNVTGFFNDVQDLVIGTISSTTQTFETLNSDAQTWGVEIESRVAVTKGLELFGNVGLMDAKYVNLGADPLNFADRKLPRVSSTTAKIGASYSTAVPWGEASLNADYSYTSPYFASASNSAISRVGRTGLVNASLGTKLDDSGLRISVGCKNCLNKEYFHSMLDFAAWQGGSGFSAAFAGDPRTYNVTLRATFGGN